MTLQNKIALVTGASRGIGRSIALALAREGARVVLAARSTRELEDAAGEIRRMNTEASVVPVDMRDEQQIRAMIHAAVKQFGRIDILINNAGLGYFKPVADLATKEWDEMFDVNVRGVFIATQAALPHLRAATESFVVNIASLAGKNAFVDGGGYAATKWALRAFSQCLMLEERKNGVRVLSVCPGSVDTGFSPHAGKKDMIKPEDVAAAVVSALRMPQRTMVSEIDIRPTNP